MPPRGNGTPSDIDLPTEMSGRLAGCRWTERKIGMSDAHVFEVSGDGRPPLFLKTEPKGRFSELEGEMRRLRWLEDQGIPAPRVVDFAHGNGRDWLLMTAVPGEDLASSRHLSPCDAASLMADALRRLHALDIADCPFDHRLDRRLPLARARAEAGVVDETDFDDEDRGRTVLSLFDDLQTLKPESEDLVVAHGDACLPNFMARETEFTGIIDCGRLGVADRYQDVAIASRSIRYNFGDTWVSPFLERYGLTETDPGRMAFYRILDEFF